MSDTEKTKDKTPPSGLGGSASRPAPGEVAEHLPTPPPAEKEQSEERKPSDDLLPGSPDGLREAADGELRDGETDEERAEVAEKEKGALDFMLSNPSPQPYTVETLIGTPEGLKRLTFHMHQIDASRIEALETEHTSGVGPFATVDRTKLSAAKIAEATDKMVDANGKETTPTDLAFLGDAIAPVVAFERMFALEPGVAEQITEQIDRMAGMTRDRVGMAERAMANAVKT